MTKRQYVIRLKRMLENAKDNCRQCPMTKGFKTGLGADLVLANEECEVCTGFVGLEPYSPIGRRLCPCARGNKTQATTRAWRAIRAYEKEEGVIL